MALSSEPRLAATCWPTLDSSGLLLVMKTCTVKSQVSLQPVNGKVQDNWVYLRDQIHCEGALGGSACECDLVCGVKVLQTNKKQNKNKKNTWKEHAMESQYFAHTHHYVHARFPAWRLLRLRLQFEAQSGVFYFKPAIILKGRSSVMFPQGFLFFL